MVSDGVFTGNFSAAVSVSVVSTLGQFEALGPYTVAVAVAEASVAGVEIVTAESADSADWSSWPGGFGQVAVAEAAPAIELGVSRLAPKSPRLSVQITKPCGRQRERSGVKNGAKGRCFQSLSAFFRE